MIEKANNLVELLQRYPAIKHDLVVSRICDRIRIFLRHKKSEVVAAGYRIARYTITNIESFQSLRRANVSFFIIKSLAQDSKHQIERVLALRLIRTVLDLPLGVKEISPGIVSALVAVADQSEDQLQNMALETLTEILLLAPKLVASTNGIRVLFQCITEGPFELSASICMAFMYVIEKHQSFSQAQKLKEYLSGIISPFTDIQVKGHVNIEKLHNGVEILTGVAKTWTGLAVICHNKCQPLKDLIDCFQHSIPSLRDSLLDLFFAIFTIKPVPWSSSFLAGRRLTTVTKAHDYTTPVSQSHQEQSRFSRHYHSFLLFICYKNGLIDQIVSLIKNASDTYISRKASLLLGELFELASNVLPHDIVKEIAALPSLYESENLQVTSSAIYSIDKIIRTLHKSKITVTNSVQTFQVKVKLGMQIDDTSFRALIADTNVLTTKSYTRWNWDVLTELIQGPLVNAKRLEEVIKTTKFMKRIMSFYRPFKYRFSSIKNTRPNQKCIRVGMELFKTLLKTKEGVKYLNENKLLSQIAECLAQLDHMSGISSTDPLFSKRRLESTLTSGYFKFLGVLSEDENGMAMLENRNMFNMFYHISELRSRDDLICHFLSAMDYNLVGHPRVIMEKALTTGQKNVRVFATDHLRTLQDSTEDTQKWAIELLVTQLYDLEVEVNKLAVEVLEEYCRDENNLNLLVSYRPSLDHLGETGNPLLLKFLSTSEGFNYLHEMEYIGEEMDSWYHGLNETYVGRIEEYLEFTTNPWRLPRPLTGSKVHQPRHFYGEITQTEEGCSILKQKGHIESFCSFIQDNLSPADSEGQLKLKGCLWAVGHAGSTGLGFRFIENSDVLPSIVEIAGKSSLPSVKGTAIYVLGLLASTIEGVDMIEELGWVCSIEDFESAIGVCVPRELETFTETGELGRPQRRRFWDPNGGNGDVECETAAEYDATVAFPKVQSDVVKREILESVTNLSNQILANEASKRLVELSTEHADKFKSLDLFFDMVKILEKYRFKQHIRRFLFELFDVSLLLSRNPRRTRQSTIQLVISDADEKSIGLKVEK